MLQDNTEEFSQLCSAQSSGQPWDQKGIGDLLKDFYAQWVVT